MIPWFYLDVFYVYPQVGPVCFVAVKSNWSSSEPEASPIFHYKIDRKAL